MEIIFIYNKFNVGDLACSLHSSGLVEIAFVTSLLFLVIIKE